MWLFARMRSITFAPPQSHCTHPLPVNPPLFPPQHPWLRRAAPDVQLDAVVIERMRTFAAMSRVKRAAMLVAVSGKLQVRRDRAPWLGPQTPPPMLAGWPTLFGACAQLL